MPGRAAVANQKGGVAKTTTVACLGAAWTAAGHRVLLVDLDPQVCLTFSLWPPGCVRPERRPAADSDGESDQHRQAQGAEGDRQLGTDHQGQGALAGRSGDGERAEELAEGEPGGHAVGVPGDHE